jgi:hypothetical protein
MAFRNWLKTLKWPFGRPSAKTLSGSLPWIGGFLGFALACLTVATGSVSAVAELIRALAALCWPVLGYVLLRTYQEEIRGLLQRIRRAKLGPGELELRENLDHVQQQVQAESAKVPVNPILRLGDDRKDVAGRDASDERRILEAASRSPRLALLDLSVEIEQELRRLLAATGWHTTLGHDAVSIRGIAERLAEMGVTSHSFAGSVAAFADMRNRLVHGRGIQDEELIRAIDIGNTILRTIRAIPAEINVVYNPGVDVFADSEGKTKREGVRALILQTTSPDSTTKYLRTYPTTRSHYLVGKRVAWEWDLRTGFPESWYRNPDNGQVEYGWTSSADFVGRHLDDV